MSCLSPEFRIKDSSGHDILMIRGQDNVCNVIYGCTGFSFKILTLDGECETGEGEQQIGVIEKRYGPKELPRGSDILEITFPMDLDVKVKATILGAAFLIDYMYYQTIQDVA